MLVREAMEGRLTSTAAGEPRTVEVRLPLRLKIERDPVRMGMMKRLASSRTFALGDRTGVLRAAQNRSGRAFRLDVRQRVVVKALVSRHTGKGAERAAALAAHVVYGARPRRIGSPPSTDGSSRRRTRRAWSRTEWAGRTPGRR